MRRLVFSAVAASSLALGGCASTPASDHAIASTATGAAIGAGAGALAGSVLPGIGTGAGACVGAAVGGVAGATAGTRPYYRDTRGYCYSVDAARQAHYNYDIRC